MSNASSVQQAGGKLAGSLVHWVRSVMRSILLLAGQAKHATHGSPGGTHLWGKTLNYPAFWLSTVHTLFRRYVLVTFSLRVFVKFRTYSLLTIYLTVSTSFVTQQDSGVLSPDLLLQSRTARCCNRH